jgi:hypothetical protein
MLTRLSKHLSFANVVAVMALFIALGSGAYAAKKLSGKSIKNNSIPAKKLKKNVLKNLDKCPAAAPTKTVGGICYGSVQAGTDWDTANNTCAAQNLRLPTIGEGLLVIRVAGGETWTDEVTFQGPPSQRAFVQTGGASQIFTGNVAGPHGYRCVINATN